MGKGLSCNEVYLSDGENIIQRNTFPYGETFYVNFDGMAGFEKDCERVFPDMQLLITSDQGDTALHLDDLYAAYEDGIDLSPPQLYAEVTVANPVHTGIKYTLYENIGDKRGTAWISASTELVIESLNPVEYSDSCGRYFQDPIASSLLPVVPRLQLYRLP